MAHPRRKFLLAAGGAAFAQSQPSDRISLGVIGSGGHYLLIRGHRLAPASTLAPFIYTQMIWTTALGFLVFGDVPHYWTIVGGLIVIASGLYLLHRETVRGKTEPSAPVA